MPLETVSPRLDTPPPRLKITDIECHVLLAPDFDASFTSSAQDSLVVVIHTDGGVFGVGECDDAGTAIRFFSSRDWQQP